MALSGLVRLGVVTLGLAAASVVAAEVGADAIGRTNATEGLSNKLAFAGAASRSETNDQQRLAPGDRVSFRVEEDRGEPKLLTVADSGELDVPPLGRIMARDRTCEELAREIKEKLEAKYYYHATVVLSVDLLNRTRGSVYLFGEIRAPGAQAIPSEETLTLSKAIIRAGGLTDFADKRHVKVTREATPAGRTNQVFTVDVRRVLEKGQLEKDLKLEPGDLIYVPGRLVNF